MHMHSYELQYLQLVMTSNEHCLLMNIFLVPPEETPGSAAFACLSEVPFEVEESCIRVLADRNSKV